MTVPQRSHDYGYLIKRWRAVAQRAGLLMRVYAHTSGFRLYVLRSKRLAADDAVYFSAGIHGDEPGSTEGLITWAERNLDELANLPCMIFPCLNPWGLVNNSRWDADRRDLNRFFHRDDVPALEALKKLIAGRRFALALMLHEDYDGQGLYIYELERIKPFWGEALLAAARRVIPVEGRALIEGRRSRDGLVRRRLVLKKFEEIGFPEAVYFHLHQEARVFTIETPSEFAIEQRVEAHVAVIDECLRLAHTSRAATSPSRRTRNQ